MEPTKKKAVIFMANDAQRKRLAHLAKGLGKSQGQVLRELIDNATTVQPMLISTFNQSAEKHVEVQHGA